MDRGWALWTAAASGAGAVEAFGEAALGFEVFGEAGDLAVQ